MKLLIHFGIYKAGSSYIQYICANQRDYLIDNNIYFPESKEDTKMKDGVISKGNADGLDSALKKEDDAKVHGILQKWCKTALVRKCNTVLISAEALVHQLAMQNRLDLIMNNANSIGYTEIKAMGFFRDLADHALSTYKHRAKSGAIPNYVDWVSKVYETPKLIENLSHVIAKNKDIQWTLRKFQKDSDFLKQAFFTDWLGLRIPKFKTRPNINESITLSEVKAMNHIRKTYPAVTDYFCEELKALPKKAKAPDTALNQYVMNVFIIQLTPFSELLNQINIYFVNNEFIAVGQSLKVADIEPPMALSDTQFKILVERIIFFNTLKGRLILVRRRLVKILLNTKISHKVFN
ncbi:MAG: hypothetical protein ACI83B_001464 [Sediminicola sp.]|jgi:hypothetical protein|tara:strand:- start:456 stop:1505 length:1050 start_codon:yes stop_codon:yes gene_type:complete